MRTPKRDKAGPARYELVARRSALNASEIAMYSVLTMMWLKAPSRFCKTLEDEPESQDGLTSVLGQDLTGKR